MGPVYTFQNRKSNASPPLFPGGFELLQWSFLYVSPKNSSQVRLCYHGSVSIRHTSGVRRYASRDLIYRQPDFHTQQLHGRLFVEHFQRHRPHTIYRLSSRRDGKNGNRQFFPVQNAAVYKWRKLCSFCFRKRERDGKKHYRHYLSQRLGRRRLRCGLHEHLHFCWDVCAAHYRLFRFFNDRPLKRLGHPHVARSGHSEHEYNF